MAKLYEITFETGDFTQWTGTPNGGIINTDGDLTVTAGAAMGGSSYGMACLLNDASNWSGYHYPIGNTSGMIRTRFYVDPNSAAIVSGDMVTALNCYNASVWVLSVRLQRTGTTYYIYAQTINDEGTTVATSTYTITDAPHYVEVYLKREVSNGSNDGILTLWIDGDQKESITTVGNYTRFSIFDWYYFGKVQNNASSTGTIYLDELVIRDDNTTIGPLSTDRSISVTESVDVTDTPTIGGVPNVNVTQSVGVTDTPTVQLPVLVALSIFVSETIFVVEDNFEGWGELELSVTETININDTPNMGEEGETALGICIDSNTTRKRGVRIYTP